MKKTALLQYIFGGGLFYYLFCAAELFPAFVSLFILPLNQIPLGRLQTLVPGVVLKVAA